MKEDYTNKKIIEYLENEKLQKGDKEQKKFDILMIVIMTVIGLVGLIIVVAIFS